MSIPTKGGYIANAIQNYFSKKNAKARRTEPVDNGPLYGVDGGKIVKGPQYKNEKNVYGYNINPDLIEDKSLLARYLIVVGTPLTLLQCEKPEGYAPFRWPPFDGVSAGTKRVGVIWVDVRELTHISGRFGVKV